MMNSANRSAYAWMAAAIVTAIVYPLAPSAPRYYPVERFWRWEKLADTPSMGWYAHAGWSLLAGFAAGMAAWWLLRRFPAVHEAQLRRALTAALLLALPYAVVAMALREIYTAAH